ncbi:MAG: hypothetical protein ACRDQZ_25335, partial [Mycobacteriales bacterium]
RMASLEDRAAIKGLTCANADLRWAGTGDVSDRCRLLMILRRGTRGGTRPRGLASLWGIGVAMFEAGE